MKKFIIVLICLLVNTTGFSQEVLVITKDQKDVLRVFYWNDYDFNGNVYVVESVDDQTLNNTYATIQARYDAGFAIVQKEYQKFDQLRLVNGRNIKYLKNFKTERKELFESMKHANLAESSEVSKCLDFFISIYKYEPIASEIKLLESCDTELRRIKKADPDNYIHSKRYKAIAKTLKSLETCSPSEIKNLSWEKTELSMNNEKVSSWDFSNASTEDYGTADFGEDEKEFGVNGFRTSSILLLGNYPFSEGKYKEMKVEVENLTTKEKVQFNVHVSDTTATETKINFSGIDFKQGDKIFVSFTDTNCEYDPDLDDCLYDYLPTVFHITFNSYKESFLYKGNLIYQSLEEHALPINLIYREK